jgi:hypothetical protein
MNRTKYGKVLVISIALNVKNAKTKLVKIAITERKYCIFLKTAS